MFKKQRFRIALVIVLTAVFACIIAFAVYVNIYYHAEPAAVQAMASAETVSVYELMDGVTVFAPEEPLAGFIFYPGGKVEPTAYAPLLRTCAERQVLCVLIHMPCNLAVFNVNGADGIQEQFPEIGHWYIGGHSLGGAMAASYAADHAGQLDGLVLLAAYSTQDLSQSGLAVLSVYGSEDGVLDMEKYEQYRPNLPADATEVVIDGGCHAGFGHYGVQDGDGIPTISSDEQILRATDKIIQVID
ncbi:MAG: alpha/beta hydrolase [Oscillospiraceae bacterium]|nr:alpha/beta hydrolase [Oscillospiraceae bacterium]